MSEQRERNVFYTDASCLPDRFGGWAFLNARSGEQASGGAGESTNQKMELEAVIRALESTEPGAHVRVVTDCENIVRRVAERRWEHWERNGWLTSKSGRYERRANGAAPHSARARAERGI